MDRRREDEIDAFLAASGWAEARREPLAADASFRRYDRLSLRNRRAVLMDAPPDREDVRPFLRIARLLRAGGFSAPAILAADAKNGFALLEDFGDRTFTRLLDGGADPANLYALAVDVLIRLHGRAAPADVPRYTDDLLLEEAGHFTGWYLPAATGRPVPDAAVDEYLQIWRALLPDARRVPEALVLRDFHVDNLMSLEGRNGAAACGLLDFQDAVAGPVSYDFVSLVEDARRDVAQEVKAAMRERYLSAFPGLDAAAFDLSCAVLGAQRHCKVLGIFARLRDRDGKAGYFVHVPRLRRLLEAALVHPALDSLRDWLARHAPADRRMTP